MRATWPFEERRRASRFGRDDGVDFAALRFASGVEIVAMVYDESLGGISLAIDDASTLSVGTEVEIAYAGCLLRATVKHLRLLDGGGRWIVGFATEGRG